MLELRKIVRYETMNGREVPIYRVTRYTRKQVEKANAAAAKKFEEEFGKPSSFNEVVKVLQEHAEEVKKEGSPATQEAPAQTQEETNGQDSNSGRDVGSGERISPDAQEKP